MFLSLCTSLGVGVLWGVKKSAAALLSLNPVESERVVSEPDPNSVFWLLRFCCHAFTNMVTASLLMLITDIYMWVPLTGIVLHTYIHTSKNLSVDFMWLHPYVILLRFMWFVIFCYFYLTIFVSLWCFLKFIVCSRRSNWIKFSGSSSKRGKLIPNYISYVWILFNY